MCAPESKAEAGEVVRYLGWSRRSDWKLGSLCIILQSSMRSGFICRFCPSAKCLVCGLALLALLLPSLSYAQVIEEGGFPVKGGVWGEPFSLSCPPRLYAQAGESVAISCSATAVPEEGVRYEWEPVSGDGLRLLSDAQVLAPLFTAPVSGEGAEYAYRLTAMSVGVYETATVAVVVGGVSGGSVQDRGKSPGLLEGCDSFGALEGFREGCAAGDKMPPSFEPFEGGLEGEEGPGLLFPEAPGLPDRPSGPVRGGGPGRQAPPRLECPVAVFLEELETGAIECHAWDASGEEYLEYSWEPVGSTTRDYLDNPRLLPEDAPNPSVVAPEAPRYDTLESFRSGETTFRYRYRLTATSRATGLSSWQEVEVYVSSNRPSVYCPLEVVVEEGETVALDCEGVDPLSARMDYDEEGASILWEWEGLWGTSTAPLDATDRSSALFTAPLGSADKQYHYIASMTSSASGVPRTARRRVTVRVAGGEEGERNAVKVTEGASGLPLDIDCVVLDSLYEGDDDKQFRCTVTPIGGDQLLSVTWTWEDPYDPGLLSATNISDPVFYVPDNVSQTTRYDFNVTIDYQLTSGPGSNVIYVYAIVHNLEVVVACDDPGSVEEGGVDIRFSCSAQHRDGSSGLTWSWSPTTRLTGHNTGTPTFDVPGDVDGDTTWTYTVTVSAPNSDPGEETVKVKVRDTDGLAPSVRCTNAKVYEGAGGIMLSCSVVNEPTGATYAWAGTDIANRLTGTGGLTPTFKPPDEVGGANKDYEYTVTLSASGIDDVAEDVTVTVLEKPDITWCGVNYSSDYSTVWEGVGSKAPSYTCVQHGDIYPPKGAEVHVYAYAWSTRGDTPASALDRLTNRNRNATEFRIPAYGTVDEDQTYEYRLTISAANADDANWDWTVLVKNSEVTVTCDDPDDVYEGDMDFDFSCSAAGPPGSTYTWLWSPVDGLTGHYYTAKPTFEVPPAVDRDTTYTYTVTASAANADDGTADVTVTVKDLVPAIACNDAEAYEGADGITLDCSATNEPTGATYSWEARGSTSDTDDLSSTTILKPMFSVPDDIDESGGADKDYDYTVTMMSGGSEVASADVTVTVKEKPDIYCPAPTVAFALYAGGPDEPLLVCEDGWKGAPVGSDYAYVWTARGTTANTDLLGVTGMETPMFDIPDAVESVERYYYTLTVSAANADDASVDVEVSVWPAPSIACTDPDPVYEGSGALTLSCSAENEPTGATYGWAGRDAANRLTGTGGLTPTFTPPRNVDANTDYDYTVTMMSGGSDVASAGVTVTVFNKRALSVVCPHRQVYEGAPDFTLSCRAVGAPAGSVYTYSWVPRQIGGLSLLSDRSSPTPTFYVPDEVDRTTTYEYWLTASADNAEDGFAYVRITVRNKPQIAITCPGDPYGAYEGSAPFALDCSASGAPSGSVYAYAWTPRGSTTDTSLLTGTSSSMPTFSVPSSVSRNETYEYRLTVSARNAEAATADVTVTVLNKRALSVACTSPPLAYEGSAPFDLNCSASGAPVGSVYAYAWTPRGSTTDTSLLTDTNSPTPTFSVPSNVDADETYEYRLTVSAQNADDATADVTVTVLNKKALSVVCVDLVPEAYEGSAPFDLNCSASGAPVGSVYAYAWTPRGSTTDTSLLTDTNGPAPTFSVPSNIDADETYEYRLTVSAQNADDATADVTVTVLNKRALSVVCADPGSVYEGSAAFDLDCVASGAPVGSVYSYVWSARGDTPDLSLLTGTSGPAPTFSVPLSVNGHETYEYTLTVSADNAEDATADVTVTVLNRGTLAVACTSPPLVYEGSPAFDLDCAASGAPGANPVYTYVWSARGDTPDLSLLTGTSGPMPTFSVPLSVNGNETYEYTLTVSAANAEDATTDVTVTVLDKGALSVACAPPPLVYEGSAPFDLNCSASGAPGANPVYSYVWSARGDTPDLSLLTGTSSPMPTFSVPSSVNGNETYEYTLAVSAANAEDATADVTVTVLDKGALSVACVPPPLVYEGSAPFDLDCSASGAPGANPVYSYVWSARGDTPDLSLLTGTSGPAPTFSVPSSVNGNETYEYTLTVSAANAEDATADVTVTVLDKGALSVACARPPLAYEGSAPFDLNCAASGAPGANPVYSYVWTARGDTPDTALLSAVDIASPTFYVPDEVDRTTAYEYLLTVSAENAESGSAAVTVTVLNAGALHVVCTYPPSVYEGSEDFDLDCAASGAPGANPVYSYVWTARGDTPDTALLSAVDIASPTFAVPDEVDATTTYEYRLTASAENAEDGSAEVTVTVLKQGALYAVCADPPPVYEGSEDFSLDCSASGAPAGSDYEYVWTARGATSNTDLLIAGTDGPTPTFDVPDALDRATTYGYLLTASAENAEDASAEVTVTVLNKDALAVACADPPLVYEGSEDFAFDCSASGAPSGSEYAYVWTARGDTPDTALLIAGTDGPTPTFDVPDALDRATIYEYLLTASAENAEDASAEVTVTVLNKDALAVACADPPLVYEGSEDFAFDCTASGAQSGSDYTYVWTARGDTQNTDLLSAMDIDSPTFYVPDEVDGDATYEYLLTVSAENAEDAEAEVTVTVLNKPDILLACADPGSVYEGSEDITFDCEASGAPGDSPRYTYVWTARGDTQDTSLLSAADIASPTFAVPDEVDGAASYEYLLTASAANAEDASAQVTVTVLDKPVLAVACAGPYSLYEGSEDFAFDCSASGAPGADPQYTYAWAARGDTPDTSLLSRADVASPTFLVPDDLPETTTYEYLLTASAQNAEDASAGVSVTVMHPAPLAFVDDSISGRVYVFTVGEVIEDIVLPDAKGGFRPYAYTLAPALLEGLELDDPTRTISGTPSEVRPRREYAWQVSDTNGDTAQIAFFIEVLPVEEPASPPVAGSSSEVAGLSALGVTVSASSLDFGVQSAQTQVSLDPMTDQISTRVLGLYHAGRMTLAPGGGEATGENGEMVLSIELTSPIVLKRADAIEAYSIVLTPSWSLAESCEQLSSQAVGGLYTEVTLSDADCRLFLFGGELDLTDVPSGQYTGSLDLILRSGESEEAHSVEVDVTVVPAQQIITIGPRGVRFSTSRELSAGLTEEQNLSIYPHVAFLTEEKPHGVFELSNPSLIPLEISVSARFGYTEATENGREVVVEDASGSRLSDLSEVVDIHPGVVVLQPGEKGLVRYGVKEGALAAMAEKGYAAFFDVVSEPRQYVRTDQMPEEVSGEKTARVTMRIPGVYVPGEGASQLRATLLSTSYVGSMSATFLVETQDHPFVGEVVAYDGDGRELGRRETLVYTRSRVRVPLDRMPEEGAVFLRFAPRGSGRVPEPASVEWDAPRRDIGASGDEGRTSLPATLVQKP